MAEKRCRGSWDSLPESWLRQQRSPQINRLCAADLFIFPARADNLPLVLQESMACGTPMVSFKVGGVPDLVRPGITGYLATPEDVKDFCNGIVQLLEDQSRSRMGQQCRVIALDEYPLQLQAKRYVKLYRQITAKLEDDQHHYTSLQR